MKQLRSLLSFALSNFGPLIVFIAANRAFGLKAAIVLSLGVAFAEMAYRRSRGQPLTLFFKFSLVITVAFGIADLTLPGSSLFKYESAATNVLTGLFFGATLFRGKPLIQEFYEQRTGTEVVMTPDRVVFFRL